MQTLAITLLLLASQLITRVMVMPNITPEVRANAIKIAQNAITVAEAELDKQSASAPAQSTAPAQSAPAQSTAPAQSAPAQSTAPAQSAPAPSFTVQPSAITMNNGRYELRTLTYKTDIPSVVIDSPDKNDRYWTGDDMQVTSASYANTLKAMQRLCTPAPVAYMTSNTVYACKLTVANAQDTTAQTTAMVNIQTGSIPAYQEWLDAHNWNENSRKDLEYALKLLSGDTSGITNTAQIWQQIYYGYHT